MRGAKRAKTIEEAQHCAEKRGYRWIKNTDPTLQYDAFKFRKAVIAVIEIKKIQHAIEENTFVEKLNPNEVEDLHLLPPPHVLREFWIRAQNERAWRRFSLFPDTLAEIGFNRGKGYLKSHFREDEW